MTMYTSRREQTHYMNGLAGLIGFLQGFTKDFMIKKFAGLYSGIDAGQILINDTACPHIEMPDF